MSQHLLPLGTAVREHAARVRGPWLPVHCDDVQQRVIRNGVGWSICLLDKRVGGKVEWTPVCRLIGCDAVSREPPAETG